MQNIRKVLLIGTAISVIVVLFFTLLIGSIVTTLKSAVDNAETIDYSEPIACKITGERSGNNLDLKLVYDSFEIEGITGKISASGTTFRASTASTETELQKIKMDIPDLGDDLDVQTFMSYTSVTSKNSPQYELLNSSTARDSGIYRKVDGYYAVALGSYYGSTIGTKYIITFKQEDGSTKTIKAILGDQKSDEHTDENHQYHNVDKSVVEFITAKGTASSNKIINETQSKINADYGILTGIYCIGNTNVELNGTISDDFVSVKGSIGGLEITANGKITDNSFLAEGFIGNCENYLVDGGIYQGGVFTWPVPGWSRISSDYGPRICPFHGREVHSGIDIPASYGTTVIAAAPGNVVLASYNGSYGNCVIISHGSSLYTLYGHNSRLLVSVGDSVQARQPVAQVGSTGSSTGNHLHFEVRKGANSYSNHTNPWNYLKK